MKSSHCEKLKPEMEGAVSDIRSTKLSALRYDFS